MTTYASDLESFPNLPPFPSDIPTAPLLRLSLARLLSSPLESERLFKACKELGFFYLDLCASEVGEKLLDEADRLFGVGERLFDVGREELGRFDYSAKGSYMGYKGFGKGIVDESGNRDRNEFYNAGKDDFLGISETPFQHPSILYENSSLLTSYMQDAHSLVTLILTHLNKHLDLPEGTLPSLHSQMLVSGDQVRFIKSPPQPQSDLRTAMGKHTDYGSVTILFNRLGGLQVLPPTSKDWCYVRPLPGHCIVNLGDAMVKFSNGLLRSNIHRVVAPPGDQAACTRYSLVYFARPGDEVPLRRLEGGNVIPPLPEGVVEEEVTSKEWIKEKAMSRRVEVYKGPESFRMNRVTNEAEVGVS